MTLQEAITIVETCCAQVSVPSPGWEQRCQIYEALTLIKNELTKSHETDKEKSSL